MRPAHSATANPGALGFRQTANTAWADEFLHLHNQPGAAPRAVASQPLDPIEFPLMNLDRMYNEHMSSRATPMTWPYQNEQPVITPAQMEMAAQQNRTLDFAGFSRPLQPTMFPADRLTDEARLADNAEQAMEAAFAAYDQDFEGAMNGWMEADGAGDLEAHVQNIRKMEQLSVEDPFVSKSDLNTNVTSTEPEKHASKKFSYDYEMMKQANAIVGTLSTNGSDEVKAKMNGSSFQGLMRAIASGKATVVDDNFIDTFTGEVIQDLVELSGVNHESDDIGNGLQNAVDSADSEGKGKGKMKSLQEQGQTQEHKDSAA